MKRSERLREWRVAKRKAWLRPRWFIVALWYAHRRIVRATRGRKGLRPPGEDTTNCHPREDRRSLLLHTAIW